MMNQSLKLRNYSLEFGIEYRGTISKYFYIAGLPYGLLYAALLDNVENFYIVYVWH